MNIKSIFLIISFSIINLFGITAEQRDEVWQEYLKEVKNDAARQTEFKNKSIVYKDKKMKYEAKTVGEADAKGLPLYIAMHGGGSAPAQLNESQWEHMKIYYLSNVKQGIYVATRGVTNTWNMHFVDEAYPLYDRLIENMVAFGGVDPARVYIMGFSAGGDGTYQIAARMPDRWAAAAMSAGHHNSVNPRNLYNLPMLLQVGDNDRAVNRYKATVEYAKLIQGLKDKEKSGYTYQLNVHFKRGHNFLDNHPTEVPQKVIEDPFEWYEKGTAKVKELNTSSVAWLKVNVRKSIPERVIWDTKTTAPRDIKSLRFYWLGLSSKSEEEIIASYNKGANKITIEKGVDGMLVMLNSDMVDLTKPAVIEIGNQQLTVSLKSSLENLRKTVRERGDKNYMFEVILKLTKEGDKLSVNNL